MLEPNRSDSNLLQDYCDALIAFHMTQGKYTKFSWVIHEIFLKANNEEKTALDTYFATEKPFKERNIPYPLIYNSYDLLLLLDKLHNNNCMTCVSQLLTSHPFTPTYHTMTLLKPSKWAANCLICQTFIGTIYLNSIKTKLFYCCWYLLSPIRGSLWIVTIADKLWDLCSH